MDGLIVLKKRDLAELLKELIPRNSIEPIEEQKEYLNFDAALEYINDRGLKISKSLLYKKTSNNEIDFKRFGARRIVFEPETLDTWINEQLTGIASNSVSKAVAETAKRKERQI